MSIERSIPVMARRGSWYIALEGEVSDYRYPEKYQKHAGEDVTSFRRLGKLTNGNVELEISTALVVSSDEVFDKTLWRGNVHWVSEGEFAGLINNGKVSDAITIAMFQLFQIRKAEYGSALR